MVERDPNVEYPRVEPTTRDNPAAWQYALAAILPVLIVFIFWPVTSGGRPLAHGTAELSDVKQLTLGVLMYANDYDDLYPLDTSSALAMKPAIYEYIKNAEIFKSLNPAGGEIAANSRLAGKDSAKLETPENVVLLYDSKPWPDGKCVVGFADGHAKRILFDDAIRLLRVPPRFAPKKLTASK